MTLRFFDSHDPDEPSPEDDALHRELDRIASQWDDEPTFEKWRRGQSWS